MKLFLNWLFGSKAEETLNSQAVLDIECGSIVSENITTEKNLRIKQSSVHKLTVTVKNDGSCKILRTERPIKKKLVTVLDETVTVDKAVEYLSTVAMVKVRFEGPFEKTKDLMQKIKITWYRQQISFTVIITDGLEHFGSKYRQDWTFFILRIHRELFNGDDTNANDERFVTAYNLYNRTGFFGITLYMNDDSNQHFEVKCPEMNIPYYDIAKSKLSYVNRTVYKYSNLHDYEYAQRVIRREAESYTEEKNRIEFVMNGDKKVVSYEEDSDEDE